MAKSIQVFLRSATSKLVVTDAQSIVVKCFPKETISKEYSVNKVKLPIKPVIVATFFKTLVEKSKHRNAQVNYLLPNIKKSWLTLIRNGQKKITSYYKPYHSNYTAPRKVSQVSVKLITMTLTRRKEKITCSRDARLFIQPTNNNEWSKLSPVVIHELVVRKLSISPTSLGITKSVRSGFAQSPYNDETQQEYLKLRFLYLLSTQNKKLCVIGRI